MSFKPIDPKVTLPELEEKTLQYWKENRTFEKSVEQRPMNKRWTFLDGPPFVTGMPHYGSLLSSLPKDLFGRYWTMKGYHVRRVWGWDGHGLPIENKVEGELNIQRKKDIEEKIGIKVFINRCLHYVNQVSSEWEWYVDHVGRWVDFKHAYKTWDLPYMESVMWVFKQMYDKGYIYKGLRVSLYCPHCSTPISNFEVAMDADNHKEMPDLAATYKYKLLDEDNTYILAWSTTPWNKIVTPALAVNPKFTYVKVRQGNEYYILAKTTLKMLKKEPKYKVIEEIKGSKLVGKRFEPHYDYYKKNIKAEEKAFQIIPGDFVTAEEGTGVVTIAAYGEEDLVVMKEQNVHIAMHVDEEGNIFPDIPKFGGMYYLKANKFVNEDLRERGLIYQEFDYKHVVPLCWRCHTRLYYAPQNAWYVDVKSLKPLMKETNEHVNWFPRHFKYGRFLKSLEFAPDWNISRNRYWGSPVPVWECECGERFVPGSIKELEEASGQKITSLHKPEIDEITVKCGKCGKTMHRTPEVLDSWIEAGSASFAERHFPFNKSEKLENFFPPDFIAEYTGQIRAWFYVLHVIGAALYKSVAFKNVLVEGVILGTDGRKMSKNFKNYPDPKEMLQKYGGDALRLYLLGSPVMEGEDILISEEQYRNQVRGTLLILLNTYNFVAMYAGIDKWIYQKKEFTPTNILDKDILCDLQMQIRNITMALEDYNSVFAISDIRIFITRFSTWYIRRSRDRVGITAKDQNDKESFYRTATYVLITICKLMAPITPFISEEIYRNITGNESVHLTDWPNFNHDIMDKYLVEHNELFMAQQIVEMALAKRKELGLRVRQPLASITFVIPENFKVGKFSKNKNRFIDELSVEANRIILEEVNIKKIIYKHDPAAKEAYLELDTVITPDLKAEGQARDIVRQIQEERKKLGTRLDEMVNVTLTQWPEDFTDYIKQNALVGILEIGDSFVVKTIS